MRLEQAEQLARAEGDTRTAHRLEECLRRNFAPPPRFRVFDDEGFDDDGPASADPLGLLDALDPEVLLDLMRAAIGPEADRLEKAIGRARLLEMLRTMITSGDLTLPDLGWDDPPRPRRRAAPRRKPATPRSGDDAEDSDDPDDPQLELF